mgnify:CR=1 FL=1
MTINMEESMDNLIPIKKNKYFKDGDFALGGKYDSAMVYTTNAQNFAFKTFKKIGHTVKGQNDVSFSDDSLAQDVLYDDRTGTIRS